MTNYPVHERFRTFQGEGVHMGVPAFFVRLFGCPIHCPWCDAAGTWHPSYVPDYVEKMSPGAILAEVESAGMRRVVITGGEPTIHDLKDLCDVLHGAGKLVHLETSGAFPLKGVFEWITVSPKHWKPPLVEVIEQADEFKFIIEKREDIETYYAMVHNKMMDDTPIWLHPEWSHRTDVKVLSAISEMVMEYGGRFRAGWQIHKPYMVDFRDPRSRTPVPLGGDEKKGY